MLQEDGWNISSYRETQDSCEWTRTHQKVSFSSTPVSTYCRSTWFYSSVDSYYRAKAPSQVAGNPEGSRGQKPSAWQGFQHPPSGAQHIRHSVGSWADGSPEAIDTSIPPAPLMVPGTLRIGRTALTMREKKSHLQRRGVYFSFFIWFPLKDTSKCEKSFSWVRQVEPLVLQVGILWRREVCVIFGIS